MFVELFLTLCVFVVFRFLWTRWKYDLHKIPSPPGLPILGHTLEFSRGMAGKSFSRWFRPHYEALGYPRVLNVGGVTWLVITTAEAMKSIVCSKKDPFPRHPKVGKLLYPTVGHSPSDKAMITTWDNTSYVKAARKVYATAFQSSQLKKALPKVQNVIDKLIAKIESKRKEGSVNFERLSVQLTLDTMGIAILDMDLGGLDETGTIVQSLIDVGRIGREQITNPIKNMYCTYFPNSEPAKDRDAKYAKMKEEWDQVARRILKRPDPPEGETPLWYNFRNLIDPETNKPISYETFRSEIATVISGGMDTTGHQLSWIFGMLATHPEIVNKLVEELKENGLYGDNAREVTYEDLSDLAYLNAIVKEGMRVVYMSVFGFVRMVPRDMNFLGYRVPKGCVVAMPGNRAVNNKRDWVDPDVARPERWLAGEDMSHKYYRAFSYGARDCIGQRFALMEMRMAILKVCSRYDLSMDCSFEELLLRAKDSIVIEAKGGMPIYFHPRNSTNV